MKILVWGTGNYAAFLLDRYEFLPHVDGFVSGREPSEAFCDKYMQGKTWHDSADLANLSFDILLIAVLNRDYIREMLSQCEKTGVPGEKIVVLPDLQSPPRPEVMSQAESAVFSLLMRRYFPCNVSLFTEEWRRYYYLHETEIPGKTLRVADGLDAESAELVRRMVERKCRISPISEASGLFLANFSSLLTESERSSHAGSSGWEERARKAYGLPEDLHLEYPVFCFDCGLHFLPEATLDSLRGRVVIDGGAYWGDSALVFQKYRPSAIHCFEPMQPTLQKLMQMVREKGLSNVVTINKGLGDRDGEEIDCFYNLELTKSTGADAGASVFAHNQRRTGDALKSMRTNLTTVDAYAQKNHLDVGLIKLDVEGVELSVVRGAQETIRRSRPVLLISVYHTPQDLFEIKPLIESWGFNYRFMIRHLSPLLDNEYMLIGYPAQQPAAD